jgi:hypothetical protein
MKKILLIGFLSIASLGISYSQDEVSSDQTQKREMSPPPKEQKEKDPNAPSFRDRLFFGGYLGMQFGSYTYIDISPLMGYMISPKLLGGVGLTYRYVSDSRFPGQTITDNQYGYRLFGRYFIIPQIFAHAEFESLNLTTSYKFDASSGNLTPDGRTWVNSALVGGGVFQGAGKRTGVFIMALYNVLSCSGDFCPYPDGWLLRVGVTAGF